MCYVCGIFKIQVRGRDATVQFGPVQREFCLNPGLNLWFSSEESLNLDWTLKDQFNRFSPGNFQIWTLNHIQNAYRWTRGKVIIEGCYKWNRGACRKRTRHRIRMTLSASLNHWMLLASFRVPSLATAQSDMFLVSQVVTECKEQRDYF